MSCHSHLSDSTSQDGKLILLFYESQGHTFLYPDVIILSLVIHLHHLTSEAFNR